MDLSRMKVLESARENTHKRDYYSPIILLILVDKAYPLPAPSFPASPTDAPRQTADCIDKRARENHCSFLEAARPMFAGKVSGKFSRYGRSFCKDWIFSRIAMAMNKIK